VPCIREAMRDAGMVRGRERRVGRGLGTNGYVGRLTSKRDEQHSTAVRRASRGTRCAANFIARGTEASGATPRPPPPRPS
jgi:hypothetical protein